MLIVPSFREVLKFLLNPILSLIFLSKCIINFSQQGIRQKLYSCWAGKKIRVRFLIFRKIQNVLLIINVPKIQTTFLRKFMFNSFHQIVSPKFSTSTRVFTEKNFHSILCVGILIVGKFREIPILTYFIFQTQVSPNKHQDFSQQIFSDTGTLKLRSS